MVLIKLLDRALEPSASVASATSSVARGPIMCTPSTSSYFLSATILTNPSAFAGHLRAAQHEKRKRADAHVVAPFLRFALGQADAADFGIAVRAGGNVIVVDRLRRPARQSARRRRCLRPTTRARAADAAAARAERNDVADSREPRNAGTKQTVDGDVAAIHVEAERLRRQGPASPVRGRSPRAGSRRSASRSCRPAAALRCRRRLRRAVAFVTLVPV